MFSLSHTRDSVVPFPTASYLFMPEKDIIQGGFFLLNIFKCILFPPPPPPLFLLSPPLTTVTLQTALSDRQVVRYLPPFMSELTMFTKS